MIPYFAVWICMMFRHTVCSETWYVLPFRVFEEKSCTVNLVSSWRAYWRQNKKTRQFQENADFFFPWYFLMINGLDFYFTFFFSSFFPTYIFLKSNHCFSHPFPHSLFLPCKKIIFKFIHCLCFCLFVETWYGSNNISFFCQHLKYIYSWVLKHWYILFFIFFFSIIDNFSGRTDAMAWPANCFSSWLQTSFFSFDFFHMLKMAEEKICIDPWNRISCSYFFIVFVF